MHPSVQPPAITKSVVLLLCLRQSDLQTHGSFQLYAWQQEFSRSADWNREGHTSKAVRRQKWIWNEPNSEQQMIYRITSLNGALSKQRRNQRWGGGFCLSASYCTSSIWTSCFIWKHEKLTKAADWGGHKCTKNVSCVAKWECDFRLRGTDAAHWNQWEESNIFTSLYVQI